MSNYWSVYCLDCKNEAPFPTDPWNHAEEEMIRVAAMAPKLKEAALIIKSLNNGACGYLEPSINLRYETAMPLDWFIEHGDHKITAVDEYCAFPKDCDTYTDCEHCGDRGRCRLPTGHDGPHSLKRKARR